MPKDGIALIIGKMKKGNPKEEEEMEGGGANWKSLARELLSAIQDEDVDALADFLENVIGE